ncbi:hypothetical protein WA538_001518 [Blastocystis sp. DL]
MKGKTVNVNVSEFVANLRTWNDAENVGSIIRSLAESISDWDGKSKLKKLRKFIATYCPEVLDDMEIMTGITENWRLEDIIYILKKQNVEGKEMIEKLSSLVSNEMVDICSEESLEQMRNLKNKFSMETLKDIIILMMSQKTVRFGWEFLDSISKSWTNDKLENLVKLIVNDEQFVDVAEGDDGGLFEFFPFLSGTVHIKAAPNDEEEDEEDSAGSLVDFIEDDVEEQNESVSSSSGDSFSEEDSESRGLNGKTHSNFVQHIEEEKNHCGVV